MNAELDCVVLLQRRNHNAPRGAGDECAFVLAHTGFSLVCADTPRVFANKLKTGGLPASSNSPVRRWGRQWRVIRRKRLAFRYAYISNILNIYISGVSRHGSSRARIVQGHHRKVAHLRAYAVANQRRVEEGRGSAARMVERHERWPASRRLFRSFASSSCCG